MPGAASHRCQLALPLVWSDSRARSIPITDVVRWMAEKPAELAGLQRKGRIEPGCDADLVVFDPEATFQSYAAGILHYRHPISPYMNETLTGVVETTYLRGVKVFDRGSFPVATLGRGTQNFYFTAIVTSNRLVESPTFSTIGIVLRPERLPGCAHSIA